MARGATLFVAAPSTSGGFSDPDILNAARFIYDRAAELGMPAVVNVSLGSDFGPHDGTSDLERGLASMVGDGLPGRVMTVASGNSGTLYHLPDGDGPYGVHTEAHVSPNAITRVPMRVAGLEGTVQGGGFVWIRLRKEDNVDVGLEGPDGEWIDLTSPGEEVGYESDDIQAAVINNVSGENASIPVDSNSVVVVWDGSWRADEDVTVLLSGRGDAQLWVTGTGAAEPGSSLGLLFRRAIKAGTVAVPASHPELIAVGCMLNRVTWTPLLGGGFITLQSFGGATPEVDMSCYFSGAGPTATGVMKPDISAPGGFVGAAMSADADPRTNAASIFIQPGCDGDEPCHLLDETHALTSGTSMAAPHVAGAAALLLQADPTLTQAQVRELLQAGASRPEGSVPYDYQVGPGTLDLVGALQVLEERDGTDPEPDLATSYYVLSSPYVRPDPTWAVQGTVEMRHADGSIASGIGGKYLSLHVEGGLVVEPLTRVRAGLWRFSVSAPRGSGGTDLTVDVRYRGQSLGQRTLPIGVDAWAAGSGAQAVGGCRVGAQPPLGRRSWQWGALTLFAAVFVARRRRCLTRS